ncbi:MAG: sulfite exporter TauE/SafE family protein [Pseudomonadales bacterium]
MAIALLAWPGALAIGLSLGLMGSGGSILTVPVLVYLLGQDEKVAIASSLAIVGCIALAGSVRYLRLGLVDGRSIVLFGVPGMAGTWLGAWASQFVSGAMQLAVFSVVMLLAAALMLRTKPSTLAGPGAVKRRASHSIVADGLAVGALTGFVGVGGGFLIVPALALLGGLNMQRAIGTSLLIIAAKSLVGFAKYQQVLAEQQLSIDYNIIAIVALVGTIGSAFGSQIGCNLKAETLKKGFGYFLILMGTFILLQSMGTL